MTKSEIKRAAKSKATHFYIKKDGCYYRPNSRGYTEFISKAGVYTKDEAISSAEKCEDLYLIPIDIKNHNANIVLELNDLLSRYIVLTNPS